MYLNFRGRSLDGSKDLKCLQSLYITIMLIKFNCIRCSNYTERYVHILKKIKNVDIFEKNKKTT